VNSRKKERQKKEHSRKNGGKLPISLENLLSMPENSFNMLSMPENNMLSMPENSFNCKRILRHESLGHSS